MRCVPRRVGDVPAVERLAAAQHAQVLLWDRHDRWGFGGDSELVAVSAEGLLAEAPDGAERYLTDGDGSLLAMWERHALLFALEGPEDEILVMRGRPHSTVPPDWADRSYRVVNEWNHTRRFCKAYVGDATERGQLPIYAEMQVPLLAGVHDPLLDEMVDCAAAVTSAFVDWLHDEGALL